MNVSPPYDRDDGWRMTLAFWGTLLVAGAIFAAVSLAPKLKTLAQLDAGYAADQIRLVELERQAIELEKVIEALEHDPAFAAELAKLEFAAPRTDRERIAVESELQLGGTRETVSADPRIGAPAIPPTLLEPLATHRGLRATLLGAAALLTLVAFGLLNEEQAATVRTVLRKSRKTARNWTERYRKKPEDREPPAAVRRNSAA